VGFHIGKRNFAGHEAVGGEDLQAFWDHQRRIVFEGGVTFVKENGEWACKSSRPGATVSVGQVASGGRSPILVESDIPTLAPCTLLLPNQNTELPIKLGHFNTSFDSLFAHRIQGERTVSPDDLQCLLSVGYSVTAVQYHCKQIAETYSRIISTHLMCPREGEPARIQIAGQSEPFFEFDAMVTGAIRTLDSLRRPLWRKYGESGSLPASFTRTLEACRRIPESLRAKLEASWTNDFSVAKEYRDCIQHYFSPGEHTSQALLSRDPAEFYFVKAFLPDNPEARSLKGFEFNKGLDVLTYSWKLTSRLVEVVKLLADDTISPSPRHQSPDRPSRPFRGR
jgi:hypothetical protein